MDCKDLMVGDWVNYKSPSSGKLRPIKIKNIYGAEFNCEVENWNIISGKSISDTEPIELTEEILVKNGWEEQTDGTNDFFVSRILPELWQYVGTDYYSYDINIKIQYVHELQHLLRLCGIEKEIKL